MIFGRELELGILTAQYEKMLAGNGSVLFLTGEAGLGKTTRVDSWWDNELRAEGRGMRDEETIDDANSVSLIPHPSSLIPHPFF